MHIRELAGFSIFLLVAVSACTAKRIEPDDHSMHGASPAMAATPSMQQQSAALPAGANDVGARLLKSPRHMEWTMIRSGNDSIRAWVVYPERRTKAPVVVVIHEIFGLTAWIRGVADQLAAEGFIAIAPDLLTGKAPLEGDSLPQATARQLISTVSADDVQRQIAIVGKYGMSLPAALPRYGIVGFCWGGGTSFQHAVRSPDGLGGSVVYYGTSPQAADLARVKVPILGLYGGNDARVDATIPSADSAMKALGKSYSPHVFEGAGHGFLRAQDQPANLAAAEKAWPLTIAFFRQTLEK
jgi:carboxymethylenebutenolidase